MIRSTTTYHYDTSDVPTPYAGSLTLASDGWTVDDGGISGQVVAEDIDGYTPARVSEDLEIQVNFAHIDAVNPSGGVGILLSDGSRALCLSVSTTFQLVEPDNVTTEIVWDWETATFPTMEPTRIRIRKIGSARWVIYVGGAQVAEIPYLLASLDPDSAVARWQVGLLSGATSATFTLISTDIAINMPVAPFELVEHFRLALPTAFREAWNPEMRGIAVAAVGSMIRPLQTIQELKHLRGCDRLSIDSGTLTTIDDITGDWAKDADLQATSERDRIRLATVTSGYLYFTWPTTRSAETETVVRGVFTLRGEHTADGDDAAGFYLGMDDGTVMATVGVYRFSTTMWGWRFGYGSAVQGQGAFPAPINASITVELRVTTSHVILVLDGAIMDRIAYTDLPASDPAFSGTAFLGWDRDSGGTIDAENVAVTRYLSDLSSRPFMRQLCAERLLWAGGAERPDELRTWLDCRVPGLPWRSTARGMLSELQRIAGGPRVYIIEETTPTDWVLDVTYPDNIWLDLRQELDAVYVEFAWTAPNFTLERLGELVASYILPISRVELVYYACLVTAATDAIAAGTAVTVDVESSRGFLEGDTVTLRSFDNADNEDCVVSAIPDSTSITLASVQASYTYGAATPAILRKILGRS